MKKAKKVGYEYLDSLKRGRIYLNTESMRGKTLDYVKRYSKEE